MDDLIRLLHIGEAEELRDLFDLSGLARREFPVLEGFLVVIACVRRAVALEYLWRIVSGIKADTEQVRFLVEGSVFLKLLFDGGEVVAHQRAVFRQRAARIDKSQKQRFAAIAI